MPYSTLEQLPRGLKDNLPPKAQLIYQEAFNSACKKYHGKSIAEQIAHRIAWAAVKANYEKHNGDWRKKKSP